MVVLIKVNFNCISFLCLYDSNKMAVFVFKSCDITIIKISLSEEISLRSFFLKVVSNLKFYQIFTKSSQSNR